MIFKLLFLVLSPSMICAKKRKNKVDMGKHLVNNGFTLGYTWWVHHGEAHRLREEVVRPRLEAFDVEAGVAHMIED
jgi:hypothetical protein